MVEPVASAPAEPQPAPGTTLTGRIAGAAALIMVGNVLSRLLGMGREVVASHYFGVSVEMYAFTIADNVRTMLFDLLISGMISAALVPVLSDYAAPERRAELRRIMSGLLLLTLGGGGAVVGGLMLAAPAVVHVMTTLITPAAFDAYPPGTLALTTDLVRAMLPAVLLLSLSAVLLAALQALQRFGAFSLSLLVPNAVLIGTVLALHGLLGLGIVSMVWGTVLGAALLVLVELPALRDVLPATRAAVRHPAVRRIGRLYLPIFLGLIVSTVALILDRNFAAALGPEVIPAMRYATQVQQMALGLVAAAIALATLPALSQAAGQDDLAAFRATLGAGLRLIVVLIVPATLGLLALAGPVVQLLFRHGVTGAEDAALIGLALLCYLPGLPFAAVDQLLIVAYYARKNTRTPVLVGVLAVLVYLAAALLLVGSLRMAGLVLANSAQFMTHALVMVWLARRSLGDLGGQGLGHALRAALLAGLPMATVTWTAAWLLAPIPGFGGDLLRVALPALVGAAVYVTLLPRLGVGDLAQLGGLVARKLRRPAAG